MQQESMRKEHWYDSVTWKEVGKFLFDPNLEAFSDDNNVSFVLDFINLLICTFITVIRCITHHYSSISNFRSMTKKRVAEHFYQNNIIIVIIIHQTHLKLIFWTEMIFGPGVSIRGMIIPMIIHIK